MWPGGLCLSRAVGDFDVGSVVLAIPHIMQVQSAAPATSANYLLLIPCCRCPPLLQVHRAVREHKIISLEVCEHQGNRAMMSHVSPSNCRCEQVRVPETGGRILIASDGVWDAFEKMLRVSRMSRSWHTEVGCADL